MQLTPLTTTRQMTVAEALGSHPDALLLTNPLSQDQQQMARWMEKMRAQPERVEAGLLATMGQEDTRRPRFELGLGIWNAAHTSTSMYFPLVLLHTHNNALITRFDQRPLLVYQTPDAIAPVAAFIETDFARWEHDVLRLSDGRTIQNDLLYTVDGQTMPLDCPNQLLMRWYGFALTFPGCALPLAQV
jgi:hypothetical protein